jgi:archaellum component FlaG (FlaF/FlaG flagellin family)
MRTLRKCWLVMFTALAVLASASAGAEASYREQMKGLDEQVQEVKSDVLSIAAELARLEERLLYPSNTHLAVFVALAERDTLRLDAVQIRIDGQLVAHSIYSFKELEALQKGGVQRIYTGNVPSGEHQIEVAMSGKLDSGKDYSRTEHFAFNKGVEPKLLGVTLGSSQLQLGDW